MANTAGLQNTCLRSTSRPHVGARTANRRSGGVLVCAVTKSTYLCDMDRAAPGEAIRRLPEGSFVRIGELPGTPWAARKALSRAARDGTLQLVRRGLYYRGAHTISGPVRPTGREVALAVLGARGVGPAQLSAAVALGLTSATAGPWHVAALRTVEPILGLTQHARSNLLRLDLSELEIAVLEVLRDPDEFVPATWSGFARRVRSHIRANTVRLVSLDAAMPGERKRTVRENFGRLKAAL